MLWLLLLHISAVLCWCGTLLYLPALIAGTTSLQSTSEQQRHVSMVLTIYRSILTPAALIAIVSGTTLFVAGEIADAWLILKLTLVATLVLCHALMGWMILLVQESSNRNIAPFCALIGAGTIILVLSIIWVVLTKPF
ncbi:CopD family protein [Nitrosomonas nitrosa]|uniref:CopD family protein n=1 Tax=Nitrosomonas nitrosa TaxID=52442 RepID=UPI0023F6B5E1|nr:CopD family protein [Nitrosomonas nitrosa]MCO6432891.1 CopD family protein [Nitrosomonas nitrosa]